MKRLLLGCLLLFAALPARAEVTNWCSPQAGTIRCDVRLGAASQFRGDPVFVVSVQVHRMRADADISVTTIATDCGAQMEFRNTASIARSAAAAVARFSWPVALEGAAQRCVRVVFENCILPGEAASNASCIAVIQAQNSRATVRW